MATARQKKKVEKVMHEHKQGTLKSSSGKKVKSRKQAIAIRNVRIRPIPAQEARLTRAPRLAWCRTAGRYSIFISPR